MSQFRAVRKPLINLFLVFAVGAFAFLAVTQVFAARRPWGFRIRPGNRVPAQASPAPQPAKPNFGTPTPGALPRPEPDPPGPVTMRDELLKAAGHDEADPAMLEQIVEIRRRLRQDPSFRNLAESCKTDDSTLEDRYEASEAAFKRALEGAVEGEGAFSVSKTTTDRDGETTYRLTIQSDHAGDRGQPSGPSALRSAARVLDARAGDSEDAGEYDRADELRDLARQLRQEARRADEKLGE